MRYEDFNLELIRCFVTVAECQSFTEAGERLHKSQSAVSVQIKKLETLLAQSLFDRTSRHVSLSEQGKLFRPYALKLLHLNEEAIGALRAPELSGSLRIGLVEYFASQRLPVFLGELKRKFPGIDLHVTTALSSELFRLLDAGEVDVIIAKSDAKRSGGVAVLLEPLHWVHNLEQALLEEARECVPLCLLPDPCIYRQHALTALSGFAKPWREVITSSSVAGQQAAIMAGLGIGVLGASCILPEMQLLPSNFNFPQLPSVTLNLYGPQTEKSKLIQPVLSHLCQRVEAVR